jgi:hypothetical protein
MTMTADERRAMIDRAIAEGRFGPARREHYARLVERDEQGTRMLLSASPLAGGLAVGVAAGTTREDEGYPPEWITPAERRRRDAPRAQAGARVVSEF